MYKIKNLSRLFLKRFWYGFRRLYEKDNTIFTICMHSFLFIGTDVAVLKERLDYCHQNVQLFRSSNQIMIYVYCNRITNSLNKYTFVFIGYTTKQFNI